MEAVHVSDVPLCPSNGGSPAGARLRTRTPWPGTLLGKGQTVKGQPTNEVKLGQPLTAARA